MPSVKTVGLISKPGVPAGAELVPKVVEWLRGRGLDVRCDGETAAYTQGEHGIPRDEVPEGCDLVIVLGGDIADVRHRGAVCPRIAYMPQGLGKNLYFELSVFENIDFFARLFGMAREERKRRIGELLEATGLGPFPDRPAGKLSGGMKQKVGLCGALIHDPDLLILDEPTTGVDPLSRQQFWALIDEIRSGRPEMSVLISTAYMDEAQRWDWIVAMDAGRVLATGTPGELMERTGTRDLEEAFVALLPPEKRGDRQKLTIPPRSARWCPPACPPKTRTSQLAQADHPR